MAWTLRFYQRLGFEISGCHPNEAAPVWAEVKRDDVLIQFHTEPPQGTPDTPVFSGTLYLHPSDVSELAEEWRGKVDFAWGPEVMPYGMREFGIQDPSGYFLAFAEPA
jgi:hypothetical protein